MIYSKIALDLQQEDLAQKLLDAEVYIDHAHKSKQGLEVVFDQEEIARLQAQGIRFSTLIPDVTAHFLRQQEQ